MAEVINTAERAIARIRELDLPHALLDIWEGKLPSKLAIHWRRPHTFFRLCHSLVDRVSGLKGLCPLWEENGETIIGILPDGRYVSYFYEDASDYEPDPEASYLDDDYDLDPNDHIRELGKKLPAVRGFRTHRVFRKRLRRHPRIGSECPRISTS